MDRTLISILAGLSGMFGWGTSDFLANQASEKIGHFKTFFWSQVAGLGLVLVASLFFIREISISPLFLGLTIFIGVIYAAHYLFFYKGFELGNVSIVSAVINSQTLFVIAIAYFFRGQRLELHQLAGVFFILLGITLVSINIRQLTKGSVSLVSGVKETLIAAALVGIVYWPLNELIVESTDWLLVTLIVKVVAVSSVFFLAQLRKHSLHIKSSQPLLKLLIPIGLLESLAVLGVNFGLREGDSIIISPIFSALTIVTIGLAMIFLKEKITKLQGVGIALTIGGIIMTAL
jgi:transporter family protein